MSKKLASSSDPLSSVLKYKDATVKDVIKYVTSPSFCQVPWDSVTMSMSKGRNLGPSDKKSIVHIHRASTGKRNIFDIKFHNCQNKKCDHKVCTKRCFKPIKKEVIKHSSNLSTKSEEYMNKKITLERKPTTSNSLASAYNHFIEKVKLSPGRKSNKSLSSNSLDSHDKTYYDKFNFFLKKLSSLQTDKELPNNILKTPQTAKDKEFYVKNYNKSSESKNTNGKEEKTPSCTLHLMNNGHKKAVSFDLHPAIEVFLMKAFNRLEEQKKLLSTNKNKKQKSKNENEKLSKNKKYFVEENDSRFGIGDAENESQDSQHEEDVKYYSDETNYGSSEKIENGTINTICEHNKKINNYKESDSKVLNIRSSLAASNKTKRTTDKKKSVHFSDESKDSELEISDETRYEKKSLTDSSNSSHKLCKIDNEMSTLTGSENFSRTTTSEKENDLSSRSENERTRSSRSEKERSILSRSEVEKSSRSEDENSRSSRSETEGTRSCRSENERNISRSSEIERTRSSGSDNEINNTSRSEIERTKSSRSEDENSGLSRSENERIRSIRTENEITGSEYGRIRSSGTEDERIRSSGSENERIRSSGSENDRVRSSGSENERTRSSGTENERTRLSESENENSRFSKTELCKSQRTVNEISSSESNGNELRSKIVSTESSSVRGLNEVSTSTRSDTENDGYRASRSETYKSVKSDHEFNNIRRRDSENCIPFKKDDEFKSTYAFNRNANLRGTFVHKAEVDTKPVKDLEISQYSFKTSTSPVASRELSLLPPSLRHDQQSVNQKYLKDFVTGEYYRDTCNYSIENYGSYKRYRSDTPEHNSFSEYKQYDSYVNNSYPPPYCRKTDINRNISSQYNFSEFSQEKNDFPIPTFSRNINNKNSFLNDSSYNQRFNCNYRIDERNKKTNFLNSDDKMYFNCNKERFIDRIDSKCTFKKSNEASASIRSSEEDLFFNYSTYNKYKSTIQNQGKIQKNENFTFKTTPSSFYIKDEIDNYKNNQSYDFDKNQYNFGLGKEKANKLLEKSKFPVFRQSNSSFYSDNFPPKISHLSDNKTLPIFQKVPSKHKFDEILSRNHNSPSSLNLLKTNKMNIQTGAKLKTFKSILKVKDNDFESKCSNYKENNRKIFHRVHFVESNDKLNDFENYNNQSIDDEKQQKAFSYNNSLFHSTGTLRNRHFQDDSEYESILRRKHSLNQITNIYNRDSRIGLGKFDSIGGRQFGHTGDRKCFHSLIELKEITEDEDFFNKSNTLNNKNINENVINKSGKGVYNKNEACPSRSSMSVYHVPSIIGQLEKNDKQHSLQNSGCHKKESYPKLSSNLENKSSFDKICRQYSNKDEIENKNIKERVYEEEISEDCEPEEVEACYKKEKDTNSESYGVEANNVFKVMYTYGIESDDCAPKVTPTYSHISLKPSMNNNSFLTPTLDESSNEDEGNHSDLSFFEVQDYLDSEDSMSDSDLSKNWMTEKSKRETKKCKLLKKKLKKKKSFDDRNIVIPPFLRQEFGNERSLSRTMAEGKDEENENQKEKKSCLKSFKETVTLNKYESDEESRSSDAEDINIKKDDVKLNFKNLKKIIIPLLPLKLPCIETDDVDKSRIRVKETNVAELRRKEIILEELRRKETKKPSDIFVIKDVKETDLCNINRNQWVEKRSSGLFINKQTNIEILSGKKIALNDHRNKLRREKLKGRSEELANKENDSPHPLTFSNKKKYLKEVMKKADDLLKRGHKVVHNDAIFIGDFKSTETSEMKSNVDKHLDLEVNMRQSTEHVGIEVESRNAEEKKFKPQVSRRELAYKRRYLQMPGRRNSNEDFPGQVSFDSKTRADSSHFDANGWFQDPTLNPLSGFSPNMSHL